jgi:hypothetical protein
MVGDATGAKMPNLLFTNNLLVAGKYAMMATNSATGQCALSGLPATTISNCFNPYNFNTNAILGYVPTVNSGGIWPTNNSTPNTVSAAMMNNYNGGVGGDYRLQTGSPYKNAGTDGKDLGADINAVNSALAGVP